MRGLNYWSYMRGIVAVFIPVDRQTGWATQPTILSEFRTQVDWVARSTYPRRSFILRSLTSGIFLVTTCTKILVSLVLITYADTTRGLGRAFWDIYHHVPQDPCPSISKLNFLLWNRQL